MDRLASNGALSVGSVRMQSRLNEICELLRQAGADRFTVSSTPEDPDAQHSTVVGAWVLAGGTDGARRQAAAELTGRLYQAEVEMESLCAEILERYEEANLVFRLSQRLATVRGETSIAMLIVEEAAATLAARAAELWLRDQQSVVLAAAVPGDDPRPWELREQGPLVAFKEGRPWLREASIGGEAVSAVPLPSPEGEPLGVLVLRGRGDGRSYRTGDIKLLSALACLASAFIRSNRLAEQTRRSEAQELRGAFARQVQRSLVPEAAPEIGALQFSGASRISGEIGGDYFGYFPLGDGGHAVALAEISDASVTGALVLSALKGVLRAETRRVCSPSELLRRTEEALTQELKQSQLAARTLIVRFYPEGRRLEYCNAGQPPALILRADGRVEKLERWGRALGMSGAQATVQEEEMKTVEQGDVLLLYSDGLIEARDAQNRAFGVERLIEVASRGRNAQAAEIQDMVLDELGRHCESRPLEDDATLIVVRAADASKGERRQPQA